MTGQLWSVPQEGGYMYSDQLSDHLRMTVQPRVKFRQFAQMENAVEEKGMHKGATYSWNTYSDIGVQGYDLDEQQEIPESGFTLVQKSLTITEAGNSVPYTLKLDALAKQQVVDVIDMTLQDDARKYFDIKTYAEFNKTPLRVSASAGTSVDSVTLDTNGTCSNINNVALLPGHIKALADLMKERNIPTFVMDDYICISHASTLRPFKNEMEKIQVYTEIGINKVYNGEYGRYEGFRFVEQNFIPKGGAQDSTLWNPITKKPDPWDNGKSSWAMFFGKETVAEAIVIPEEIRAKIPGDYGRSRGLAWYFMGGYGLIHADERNARVLKWDSAK